MAQNFQLQTASWVSSSSQTSNWLTTPSHNKSIRINSQIQTANKNNPALAQTWKILIFLGNNLPPAKPWKVFIRNLQR